MWDYRVQYDAANWVVQQHGRWGRWLLRVMCLLASGCCVCCSIHTRSPCYWPCVISLGYWLCVIGTGDKCEVQITGSIEHCSIQPLATTTPAQDNNNGFRLPSNIYQTLDVFVPFQNISHHVGNSLRSFTGAKPVDMAKNTDMMFACWSHWSQINNGTPVFEVQI